MQSFDRWFLGLIILAAFLLFVRLGSAPIYILDEAKNAQCAREMWNRGDWVVPTFNGELRTDKPALHYWFMRVAYTVANAGPAQARFFSAVFGLLLVMVTYFQVQKWAGKGVAFFSAAALVLSTHFLFEFRLSVPDPYLIFFTSLGLFFGYDYLERSNRLSLLLTACLLGLAMLAKGPVALALPGLICIIFLVYKRKWSVFRDPLILVAVLLALAITIPWYYAVHVATDGAFTRGFFLDHNLNRFAAEKEGHGGPFIITPIIVILGMLPASLFAIGSLRKKSGYWQKPFFVFSFISVAVYVVFFSVSSTKLPNYPMPCYPFVAILAGYFIQDVFTGNKKISIACWISWMVLALAIPVGGYFALRNEPAVKHLAWIALCLFILPTGILVAWQKRKQVGQSLWVLSLGWYLFSAILLWVGYPIIYRENPVSKLIPEMEGKGYLLAYKSYNPAFNFNLKNNSYLIPVVQTKDSLAGLVSKKQAESITAPIYLVTRLEYLSELDETGFMEVGRYRDLFELPTTVILKWKQ